MTSGSPLTDEDREPWLQDVGRALDSCPTGIVCACSALRRRYRDILREHSPTTTFVHLQVEQSILEDRMTGRSGHFMPASLLASQLKTLEPLAPDELGFEIAAQHGDQAAVVERVMLGLRSLPD
jgi:carbohydrate kinase (thermoresistant glucokinase family)